MTAYDDASLSCPHCSVGLEPEALCDCDDDPCCVRCHRVQHVEINWMSRREAALMAEKLQGWGVA